MFGGVAENRTLVKTLQTSHNKPLYDNPELFGSSRWTRTSTSFVRTEVPYPLDQRTLYFCFEVLIEQFVHLSNVNHTSLFHSYFTKVSA